MMGQIHHNCQTGVCYTHHITSIDPCPSSVLHPSEEEGEGGAKQTFLVLRVESEGVDCMLCEVA